MGELFVKEFDDVCEVWPLFDKAHIVARPRCGCTTPTCCRQTKGTPEYNEYLAKREKDPDIFYKCPNGTFFEIDDDRLKEAEDIYAQMKKYQKSWLVKKITGAWNSMSSFDIFNSNKKEPNHEGGKS